MEPAIGRFTSVDPLAELNYSMSLYIYVDNNPLRFIDPTGMLKGDTIEEGELRPVEIIGNGPKYNTYNVYSNFYTASSISSSNTNENSNSTAYFNSINTSLGAIASYKQYTQYSKNLGIWRCKNGKMYQGLKGRGPNGYTGSRDIAKMKALKIGRISQGITVIGIVSTYTQYQYDMKQNPGPNLKHHLKVQHAQDQLVNLIGLFGNEYGAALSVGYNLGHVIEGIAGQNIRFNPYTMDFTPIEETLTEYDNMGIYLY